MKSLNHSIVLLATAALLSLSTLAFAQAVRDDRLYQDLGRKEGITRIVETLSPIILADPRINQTFVDVDMKHLRSHLVEQFCVVSGGPEVYTGKDMKTMHTDLKINQAMFNALVENLQQAMDKQGIPSSVQNRLLAKLAPMHTQVIER
jgi:hemoglobin